MQKLSTHFMVLAFIAMAPQAWADLPDCGNEGQRTCKITDYEYSNNGGILPSPCEFDLIADGGVCKNRSRRTLPRARSWVGWALMNQRYQIGADLPVNLITTVGAHNANSNLNQGNANMTVANQRFSITDLLQIGMRYLEIDPHFYNGNVRMCHASNSFLCTVPTWSANRLYAQLIREIANWLESNPGEVIIVKLDDHLNDLDLSDHVDSVIEPIQAYLGSKVLRTYEKPSGRWPTMAQLRSSGKQVIFLSRDKNMESNGSWVFYGNTYFPTNDHPQDVAWSDCKDADGKTNATRGVSRWTVVSEGRSMSNLAESTGLFTEALIASAHQCGFGLLGIDFVNALEIPNAWGLGSTDPDTRLRGAIWSWKEGDRGQLGPAMLRSDGRWESQPQFQARPFACAKSSPADTFEADQNRQWKISLASGAWGRVAGDDICTAEFGAGFEFAFPRSAYQNAQLMAVLQSLAPSRPEVMNGVWLKFNNPDFQPLPEPVVAPKEVTFIMSPGGSLPAPKPIQVHGSVGQFITSKVTMNNVASKQWLSATLPALPKIEEGPFDVTVSIGTGAQTLAPGVYTGTVQVGYQGQYSGVGDLIHVTLKVLYESTTTLTVSPNPAIATQQPIFSATVRSADPNFPIRGRVKLYEVTPSPNPTDPPVLTLKSQMDVCPINSSVQTINLAAAIAGQIPLGTHRYIVRFTSEGNCMVEWLQDSDSNEVELLVLSRLTPNPRQVNFRIRQGGALPTPVQVNPAPVTGDKPTFTITQGGEWMQIVPDSGGVKVSLKTAAQSLVPGTYTGKISVTDPQSAINGDAAEVIVTLQVTTTITPVPETVELIAGKEIKLGQSQLTTAGTVPYKVTASDTWIVVPQPEGTAPGPLVFGVNPAGKSKGTYNGSIAIESPLADAFKVYVRMIVVEPTTITSDPEGITVVVDGQQVVTPATFNWQNGTSHTLLSPLVATGPAVGTRYSFLNWNGQTNSFLTINAGSTLAYKANFKTMYKLTAQAVPAEGGSIGILPVVPEAFYDKGAQVTLTAQPNATYAFAGYSGDVTGTNPQTNVVMGAPRHITAAFSRQQPHKVLFTSNVAGGKVIVDGTEYATPITLAFEPGRAYKLGVVSPVNGANASTRHVYASWSNTSQRDQNYTATGDVTLGVVYSPEYLVTAAASPQSGGSVNGGGWYGPGRPATIQAISAPGYVFTGFSGAITGQNNPQSVSVNGPLNIAANFSQAQPPQLYATVGAGRIDGGTGQRIVTLRITNAGSNPAGQVQVNSISAISVVGGSGPVSVASPLPIIYGDLATSGFGDQQVVFNWPATATRIRFTVSFSANGGTYQGSNTLTLFR